MLKEITNDTMDTQSSALSVEKNTITNPTIAETNTPTTAQNRVKLSGYEFYRNVLGSPKFVVAPMVDQSELAWRMLCRKYGAQLCYTPMYHSNLFANDAKYRKDALQSCEGDRPLILQFCGNDAQILLEAALLAQDHCDAIDINLGCPQAIARRGHYGSFLQDEWELLRTIVRTLHERLSVPVTCKIRIFENRQRTIDYAKMLEAAGCQLLTVHGRTRDQKGPLTGVADWSYIRDVRQHIKIPMFANGNILGVEDIERCIAETGVDGVMTAEGNLHNPAIFTGKLLPTWQVANEYLDFVELYPCAASTIRGHMFKIFHHLMNLQPNAALRDELAVSNQPHHFRNFLIKLKAKYEPFHSGGETYNTEEVDPTIRIADKGLDLYLPPWLCQPYIRVAPELHKAIIAEKVRAAEDPNRAKRQYFDNDGKEISRKRMKKLRRRMRRPHKSEGMHDRVLDNCEKCQNPPGSKCVFRLCRLCCREKCYVHICDCRGHGFLIKTRSAAAKVNGLKQHKNDSGIVEKNAPTSLNDVMNGTEKVELTEQANNEILCNSSTEYR